MGEAQGAQELRSPDASIPGSAPAVEPIPSPTGELESERTPPTGAVFETHREPSGSFLRAAAGVLFYPAAVLTVVFFVSHRSRAPDLLGLYSRRYAVLLAVMGSGIALIALALFPKGGRAPATDALKISWRSQVPARLGPLFVFASYFSMEYFDTFDGLEAFIALPPLLLGLVRLPIPVDARAAWFGAVLGCGVFFHSSNLLLLLGFSATCLCGLHIVLDYGTEALVRRPPAGRSAADADQVARASPRAWRGRTKMALGSALLGVLLVEAMLVVGRASGLVEIAGVLPKELERRRISGRRDYYWQGVFHNYNEQGFRGGDLPTDGVHPGRFRIVVLGDSLTYGYGVAEEATYPAVIRRTLGGAYGTEVLNLGSSGAQSEDILEIARQYVPRLHPDLVLYGHCPNDFLPSGVGEYTRYSLPVPSRLKEMLTRRTLSGSLADAGYSQLLIRLGLRDDFFSDILKDFRSYDTRFARDVGTLNALVSDETGLPVVSMVLNQYPSNSKGRMVSRLAEARMREAGMLVVPAEPYMDRYAASGAQLHVNRWEGHPNELAHSLFAEQFVRAIEADSRIVARLGPFHHCRAPDLS